MTEHEIQEAEMNKERVVVHSKQDQAYNRGFTGYELINISSEDRGLYQILMDKAKDERNKWNVMNKYDTHNRVERDDYVITILMKNKNIDRRYDWYVGKLSEQWCESVAKYHERCTVTHVNL